jgi:hypothetical protein
MLPFGINKLPHFQAEDPYQGTEIWDFSLVDPEWHSVKRNIFYINPLRRIIPHVFPGRPLRLAGQSSLDSPGVQFAPRDGQYSGQVGLASPQRYAG